MSHYIYRVSGRGEVPRDMLRYDECWGVGRNDRKAIIETDAKGVRAITLIGPRPPTTGRWESFGWTVTSITRHAGPLPERMATPAENFESSQDVPQTMQEAW